MKPDTPASPGLGDLGDDADKTRLPIDVPDPPDLRGARNLYSGAVPHRVGRYNIRHTIASGGMGTVYEATQDNPRRVVAVKVMKHGIASHSALRRFEFEAQLLARLHHPGIAQIFEAGTHDDGSGPVPYFAMEYIAGARPITAYATENKLSTRARLELFTHVCDAVHHGHQRGIIHRDLKPSNILVDGQGEVKIIDFGVARGTDAELGFTTLQTDVGELIGTLQYMSPEQCAADPHDIDVRSDVYALGAVLYELLSSRLPYDVRGKSALEGTRIVREQEPLRLSAATSAEGPPTRELRGDVETIVVKALQKDRERRYQSALELVQDIRRYLSDEAIVARPPSLAYQFRIFARRHKALFGAGATVLVVLLAATMVSTSLYFRAERERLRTARAYDRLVLAERDTASVSGFFKDMLGTLDPDEPLAVRGQSPSTDMKVRELLESASERVKERFAGRPALEAEVRETLARAFFALGRFDEAEPQARQALRLRQDVAGPNDPDTRKAMEQLAGVLLHRGQINEGLTLRRAVLDSTRRTKGPNDRETLLQAERLAVALTACSRFAEAEALARDTNPQRAGLGSAASALQVAWLFHLSEMVNYQGRLREGEQLARDALDLAARSIGSNTQLAAYSKLILVDALREQGRLAEAEKVMREALADYRRLYGESHPWVDSCNMYLMRVLAQSGQLEEAETALRQSLERQRRELGDDSPYTLKTMIDLLRVLNRRGKFDQAEQLAEDLLPVVRRARGDESHHTVEVLHERSIALCGLGRIEEAEPIARDVVEASQRLFRTGYFHLPNFHDQWGQCLLDLRRYDQAEREFNLAYEGELAMRGPEHLNTREVVAHLVRLYETWGRPDDAARWRERMPAPSTPASGPADGPLH